MIGSSLKNIFPASFYMAIVLLLLYAQLTIAETTGSQPPDSVLQQAKTIHSDMSINYEFIDSEDTTIPDHVWTQYVFTSKEKNWPYGSIYILWNKASAKAVWALSWRGDFQPHSVVWLDFNNDGQKDLFFYAGEEDVFSTHIYLWNVKHPVFSKNNLVEVYSNQNDYSVVLDFENDGHPEIFDSGYLGDEHVDPHCGQEEFGYPVISPKIKDLMRSQYRKLAGPLDKINFTYNLPEAYPVWAIGIFDPFHIYRIENRKRIEVSLQYQNHLKWRRNILKLIHKDNKGSCLELVNKAIKHVDELIKNAK